MIKRVKKTKSEKGKAKSRKKIKKVSKTRPDRRRKIKGVKKEDLLEVSRGWERELAKEKAGVEPEADLGKVEKEANDVSENDKKLIMWAGVSFFMVLIFVIWIFNIKSIFKPTEQSNNESQFDWSEFRDEFGKTMEQVKEGLDEIKNEVNFPLPTSVGEQADSEVQLGDKNNELNKEKIMELKERLETGTED